MICKFHMTMSGGCTNGACKFEHPTPKPKVCAHFAAGTCKFGTACRDWHAPAAKAKPEAAHSKSGAGTSDRALVVSLRRAVGSLCVGGSAAHALPSAATASGTSVSVTTTTTVRRVDTATGSGGGAARSAVAKRAPKTVDLVLSFDTTGSMYSYLDTLRKALAALVRDLTAKAARHGVTLRIGVIAHGDYCDKAKT